MNQRLRIRFRKEGDLRFIGHLDLTRAFERLFRRVDLPLAMTQGFHPHAKINFPSALALGIEGHDEIVEITLADSVDVESVHRRLREQSPAGLVIASVTPIEPTAPKPRITSVIYEIKVPSDRVGPLQQRINQFLQAAEWPVVRDRSNATLDIRPHVRDLLLDGDTLRFRLNVSRDLSVKPREVLTSLQIDDLEDHGYCLSRTRVELAASETTYLLERRIAK
jgi:radical SAM-linked protein